MLSGGEGNDFINGCGDDELHGGQGDDILVGESGSDTLYGGAGSDVYAYNASLHRSLMWHGRARSY